MLSRLKNILLPKRLALNVSKTQKEILDMLMANKPDFDTWVATQAFNKIRLQFFYPTAVDFFYDEFKLFTAYFKKNRTDSIELQEMKMTEMNYDSIRCTSWAPFEEMIIDFLTSLEESKKNALFEKRKTLIEYQSLCTKNGAETSAESNDSKAVAGASFRALKPTQ